MDRARVYKNNTSEKEVTLSAADVLSLVKDVVGYFAYIFGYTVFTVIDRCKSDKVKSIGKFYQKYLSAWVVVFAVYFFIGIVGGLEAGLISLSIGIPCCVILLIIGAIFTREK